MFQRNNSCGKAAIHDAVNSCFKGTIHAAKPQFTAQSIHDRRSILLYTNTAPQNAALFAFPDLSQQFQIQNNFPIPLVPVHIAVGLKAECFMQADAYGVVCPHLIENDAVSRFLSFFKQKRHDV